MWQHLYLMAVILKIQNCGRYLRKYKHSFFIQYLVFQHFQRCIGLLIYHDSERKKHSEPD